jgi:hypothetical protein
VNIDFLWQKAEYVTLELKVGSTAEHIGKPEHARNEPRRWLPPALRSLSKPARHVHHTGRARLIFFPDEASIFRSIDVNIHGSVDYLVTKAKYLFTVELG